ncbi:MAG: Rnf-Nqr domain containing protein [bacterium]
MADIQETILAIFRPVLDNNYALSVLLATCLYLQPARRVKTALPAGTALTVSISLAALLTFVVNTLLLAPYGLGYMLNAVLALFAVLATQAVIFLLHRRRPALLREFGDETHLFAAAFTLLVLAARGVRADYGFVRVMLNYLGAGFSFLTVLFFYAGIRERLELSPIPRHLRGLPAALLTIGLVAAAFRGIEGIVK